MSDLFEKVTNAQDIFKKLASKFPDSAAILNVRTGARRINSCAKPLLNDTRNFIPALPPYRATLSTRA